MWIYMEEFGVVHMGFDKLGVIVDLVRAYHELENSRALDVDPSRCLFKL